MPSSRRRLPNAVESIQAAAARLDRHSNLLTLLFPELAACGGTVESPLVAIPHIRTVMAGSGNWLIKADHGLPIAGSIKARGGIYEVLLHAEQLALDNGLITPDANGILLNAPAARALFAAHTIAVGSTGNLGLGVGIIAAALGFRTVVHMAAAAKDWKKAQLRRHGVTVVEHTGDYAQAVAAGREQASHDPTIYFVDDENSANLFVGYAVAALRLRAQLAAAGIAVDAQHPLFVYLPCGVGGAPGGITLFMHAVALSKRRKIAIMNAFDRVTRRSVH
jgi:D-serine dehydratase